MSEQMFRLVLKLGIGAVIIWFVFFRSKAQAATPDATQADSYVDLNIGLPQIIAPGGRHG